MLASMPARFPDEARAPRLRSKKEHRGRVPKMEDRSSDSLNRTSCRFQNPTNGTILALENRHYGTVEREPVPARDPSRVLQAQGRSILAVLESSRCRCAFWHLLESRADPRLDRPRHAPDSLNQSLQTSPARRRDGSCHRRGFGFPSGLRPSPFGPQAE